MKVWTCESMKVWKRSAASTWWALLGLFCFDWTKPSIAQCERVKVRRRLCYQRIKCLLGLPFVLAAFKPVLWCYALQTWEWDAQKDLIVWNHCKVGRSGWTHFVKNMSFNKCLKDVARPKTARLSSSDCTFRPHLVLPGGHLNFSFLLPICLENKQMVLGWWMMNSSL